MFTSLRSRLWISYALLIAIALSMVALVLLIYLVRNPLVYRQTNQKLSVVETILTTRQQEWADLSPSALQLRVEQIQKTFDVRVLIFDRDTRLLADSHRTEPGIPSMPPIPRLRALSVVRDENGTPWIYKLIRLNNGRWLMVSEPKPRAPLLSIFRDEFVTPFVQAGLIALILSLLLAYWMARWVGDPVQQVVTASREMPKHETKLLTPHGPREVRELINAFNEMNIRVQASQKSQRDFVANVSHELKTPLTSIQGFAQAILDGTANTGEARDKAANVIYDEASRMHRMVLDLLDLARLDAGTADLLHAPVDLRALLNNVIERFTPQARLAGITIKIDTEPLPPIIGDGDRLAQVFTNLIDNAMKFTPKKGFVTIQTSHRIEQVEVTVSDNGRGILPEALPHVFERFYRADPSRTGGKEQGAGLGLAIAAEIVQAHGGTIGVRSTPGKGSTFVVRLPISMPDDSTVIHKTS